MATLETSDRCPARRATRGLSLWCLIVPLACSSSEPSADDGGTGGTSGDSTSTIAISSATGATTTSTGATAASGSTRSEATSGSATTGSAATGSATTGGATTGGATTGGGASTATGATGSSMGGGTATGGAASTGTDTSATATTGSQVECSSSIAATATRPQLSSEEAAQYTVAGYLASAGPIGALTVDNWDPTGGLGDPATFAPNATVASDGSGTHQSVQAAVDSFAGSGRQYILVKPGTYRETISIPSSAPPITLYSTSTDPSQVVIVDGKSADSAGGTSASSTFTVKSTGFQALNLTISNDFATPSSGSGLQAVALHTQGDQTVLENVTLHGFQDTLYVDTLSDTTVARVYIKDSFIEGDTDFIFGRATLVIQGSTIHYLSSRKGSSSGIHLAPSTHVNQPYGFLVTGSMFTADGTAPANKVYLGRSWDTSSTTPTPNGQVVIRESVLGAHIRLVDPWAAAATSGREFSASGNRLQEYCNSGPGAG